MQQDELKEWVYYCPITGVFTRKRAAGNTKAGSRIGNVDAKGYLKAMVLGKYVKLHQLAWFYVYGVDSFNPNQVVRHLNGDTLDFSKANLVLGTHSENNLDKSAEVRIAAARKARASQPVSPGNSKLLPYQVAEIRTAYANLTTKKAPNGFTQNLCTTYGVSRTVIHKIIKGKYYRES